MQTLKERKLNCVRKKQRSNEGKGKCTKYRKNEQGETDRNATKERTEEKNKTKKRKEQIKKGRKEERTALS